MTITFNEIPAALRYPGAYIEIDGSQAGLSGDLPAVLLVGLKLPSGTAPAGEVIRVASPGDAELKAGAGSMLAQMAAAYRKKEPTFDMYLLPYAESYAGSYATGRVMTWGQAKRSGTLSIYIAQRPVHVPIAEGQYGGEIALAIVRAIERAGTKMAVTATISGQEVLLVARHRGAYGNDIDLRLGLYGESLPEGLDVWLSAMSGGYGNPEPGDLSAIIGKRWFRYISLGLNDDATLAAWHTESQRRYAVPIQAGFRALGAFRGSYEQAAQYGERKNYEHISTLWIGLSPCSTWEAAATLTGAAALSLFNNPVSSMEGISLPGLQGDVNYNDFAQGNSLLFKGMSVMEVGADGSCSIKRLISMYQRRSDGSSDDAFLDINVAEVMERIRYEQRMGAIKRFRGSTAAKTNEGYRPGLRITTEDSVCAFLLSLYKNVLQAQYGWVQAYDYYKQSLVVEQDPNNPSRFNFKDDPVINSPFYILAGRAVFRKAVPAD